MNLNINSSLVNHVFLSLFFFDFDGAIIGLSLFNKINNLIFIEIGKLFLHINHINLLNNFELMNLFANLVSLYNLINYFSHSFNLFYLFRWQILFIHYRISNNQVLIDFIFRHYFFIISNILTILVQIIYFKLNT